MLVLRKSIEWEMNGKRFLFLVDGANGEFRAPNGQRLALDLDTWRSLAFGLHEVLGGNSPKAPKVSIPGAPNAGQPWTDALDAELSSRWRQCADVATLAKEFGRTDKSIVARLLRLGVVVDHDRASTAPGH
jgi:hypothetical protein